MPTVLKTIFLLLCNHIYSFTVVRSIANSFPSHIPARYSYARCLSSFLKRPKKYFLLYTLLLLYSYRADLICCWTVNITLIFKKRDTGISVIFLHRYRRTFERYQKRAALSSDIYICLYWRIIEWWKKRGCFQKIAPQFQPEMGCVAKNVYYEGWAKDLNISQSYPHFPVSECL